MKSLPDDLAARIPKERHEEAALIWSIYLSEPSMTMEQKKAALIHVFAEGGDTTTDPARPDNMGDKDMGLIEDTLKKLYAVGKKLKEKSDAEKYIPEEYRTINDETIKDTALKVIMGVYDPMPSESGLRKPEPTLAESQREQDEAEAANPLIPPEWKGPGLDKFVEAHLAAIKKAEEADREFQKAINAAVWAKKSGLI